MNQPSRLSQMRQSLFFVLNHGDIQRNLNGDKKI
jgi:hypothetical protein